MESVEASGKSIEDAILQALARLGRNRNEVEITVLQEPSRGQRGMGARDARVRVHVVPTYANRPPAAPDEVGEPFDDVELDLVDDYPAEADEETVATDLYTGGAFASTAQELATTPLKDLLSADASIEEVAIEALRLILAHMGVRAAVDVSEPVGETDEEREEEPLTLNIHSDDNQTLALLIGRRGETLASLQLLVNLIVNKQTGVREHIIVDAEGYRERRERNLRAMAARIAEQVRRSGMPIMLEAMPPNERRIIHMALAESGDISTESTGEGDQRRVVISLNRSARA